MSQKAYLAIDGDDIGRRIEYLMLTNQDEALRAFSRSIAEALELFSDQIVKSLDAETVLMGGDNILFALPPSRQLLEESDILRKMFREQTGCSLSMGIGESAREAYIALKFAKASGKDRICTYDRVWYG